MKSIAALIILILVSIHIQAQSDTSKGTFWQPKPRNYQVKHAIEVESLVPMFFYGGYHFAVCYRYKRFRVRFSVIDGGSYDAEKAGINNSSPAFKRFYEPSPGLFFGYNVWKNLELYTYIESHTFKIEQQSTGVQKEIGSYDTGAAASYQFFIGKVFYIQPGIHLYLRTNKTVDFSGVTYHIPNADYSIVLRLGARLWRSYK